MIEVSKDDIGTYAIIVFVFKLKKNSKARKAYTS